MKHKHGYAEQLRRVLARARKPKTIADIRESLGVPASETKYISAQLLKFTERGEAKRKKNKEGLFIYQAS